MEPLAHWWNGTWAGMARKDVWVERLSDGRYQVRWRGGDWRDRDGTWRSSDKKRAWDVARHLMDNGDTWKRVDSDGL